MRIEPHQQRVLDECQELIDKFNALKAFIQSETFRNLPNNEECRLLMRQLVVMGNYIDVLRQRIALWYI